MLAAAAFAAPSLAQVDQAVLARIEQGIRDLDSADLATRERATVELGDARRYNVMLLQDRLFDPGLSEEQRLRLFSAGFRLFAGSVRGAMGVQFSDSTPQGVVIGRTIEGFDSRVTLRPEDVIRTIDGRPVLDQDHVRALIISHDPGDEVPIGLLRNGEALALTLRMGRFDQLADRRGGPDEASLQQAWRVRLARLAKAAAAKLPAPIDAVDVEAEQEDFDLAVALERVRPPARQEFDSGYSAASLVAGGEPRGMPGWNTPNYLTLRGGNLVMPADPVAELIREMNATQREMIELEIALNEIRAVIEDPNTPAARRQELMVRRQVMEGQLREFEQQLRNIQQRLVQGRQIDRAIP